MSEPILTLQQRIPIADAEFCFQFNDEEPQVFAWNKFPTPDGEDLARVVFTVEAVENSSLEFQKNGKIFKIFARQITEETKALREREMEAADKFYEEHPYMPQLPKEIE
jgi:hypothetical protein